MDKERTVRCNTRRGCREVDPSACLQNNLVPTKACIPHANQYTAHEQGMRIVQSDRKIAAARPGPQSLAFRVRVKGPLPLEPPHILFGATPSFTIISVNSSKSIVPFPSLSYAANISLMASSSTL
eukprot:scaffold101_cov230-Pinguiococcus_pyrenoidosus.AAC.7